MAFSLSHVPFLHLSPSSSNLNPISRFQNPNPSFARLKSLRIRSAKSSQRIGKRRYPSEKKKLEQSRPETLTDVKNKEEGFWRLSKLSVPVDKDPGKDHLGISEGLLEAIAKVLEFPVSLFLVSLGFKLRD